MEKEFVIWGIAPSKKHEELLVSSVSYIKSMADAKKYCDILEKKHGCTNTRVQVIDFSKPLKFDKTIIRLNNNQ